jgi:hypothetical protein
MPQDPPQPRAARNRRESRLFFFLRYWSSLEPFLLPLIPLSMNAITPATISFPGRPFHSRPLSIKSDEPLLLPTRVLSSPSSLSLSHAPHSLAPSHHRRRSSTPSPTIPQSVEPRRRCAEPRPSLTDPAVPSPSRMLEPVRRRPFTQG